MELSELMKLLASLQLRENGYTISSLHMSLKEEEIGIFEKQELEWKSISVAEFKQMLICICLIFIIVFLWSTSLAITPIPTRKRYQRKIRIFN